MYPVRLGFIPGSDEAIISIFNNPQINSSRGQLEARGAGFKLMRGDLALRANFATIDSLDKGNVIDRRAGRTLTSYEAEILAKDDQRNFNEAQKIAIYRHDKGLCQICLSEGKSEKEARVSWSEYEADHILAHSKGGATDVDNAQVLCRTHNRKKSGK